MGAMRPTTFIGLAALVITGVIIADAFAHPAALQASANGIVAIATPTYGALLGQVPAGYKKAG